MMLEVMMTMMMTIGERVHAYAFFFIFFIFFFFSPRTSILSTEPTYRKDPIII